MFEYFWWNIEITNLHFPIRFPPLLLKFKRTASPQDYDVHVRHVKCRFLLTTFRHFLTRSNLNGELWAAWVSFYSIHSTSTSCPFSNNKFTPHRVLIYNILIIDTSCFECLWYGASNNFTDRAHFYISKAYYPVSKLLGVMPLGHIGFRNTKIRSWRSSGFFQK